MKKEIRSINNLKWTYAGRLNNFKYVDGGGVYLFVYKGSFNRIIYVGTTYNFERRWYEHFVGMQRGNRAVWKVEDGQDIYELMSFSGKQDHFKYYRNLALDLKLWASTSIIKVNVNNDLNINDNFEKNWKLFTQHNYIPNINIWACRMCHRMEYSSLLESQIQKSLSINFRIGSHINKVGMSWLGKIEHTENAFNVKFHFENYPEVDDDTTKILKNLENKKIIRFSKKPRIQYKKSDPLFYIKKNEEKRKKIKLIKQKYALAFTEWILKEEQILIFLVMNNIGIEEIANTYLQRPPIEIRDRIKFLKKWGRL